MFAHIDEHRPLCLLLFRLGGALLNNPCHIRVLLL
jgi:hypothetical protein